MQKILSQIVPAVAMGDLGWVDFYSQALPSGLKTRSRLLRGKRIEISVELPNIQISREWKCRIIPLGSLLSNCLMGNFIPLNAIARHKESLTSCVFEVGPPLKDVSRVVSLRSLEPLEPHGVFPK